jgi:hypothetical protein
MTNQHDELLSTINGVLDRWAPFKSDPFDQKVMRALLNLAAFEKDIARKRAGETPIRTDYPISLE